MQWYNEPDEWQIIKDNALSMYVTPKTDYWRKTLYGFTVDDGPFYYARVGGEFRLKVKITGAYRSQYDQMGIMIRADERTWIKTGVEYVDEKINLSAVVTREFSDWSVIELDEKPAAVWLDIVRKLDSVEIKYSLDNERFTLMRLAYFPEHRPLMVGPTAASPDGDGFEALFEDFSIQHLPDTRRSQWLVEHS